MEITFKILTGTAKEVENQLNELKKYGSPMVNAMSATDNTTTILLEYYTK